MTSKHTSQTRMEKLEIVENLSLRKAMKSKGMKKQKIVLLRLNILIIMWLKY